MTYKKQLPLRTLSILCVALFLAATAYSHDEEAPLEADSGGAAAHHSLSIDGTAYVPTGESIYDTPKMAIPQFLGAQTPSLTIEKDRGLTVHVDGQEFGIENRYDPDTEKRILKFHIL